MAGTTQFSFKIKLLIGSQVIPLDTEFVTGAENTQDGVKNGFLFKLDLKPGEVVKIPLGEIIQWIETKMGYGDLASNPGMGELTSAFPGDVTPGNFTEKNKTEIEIKNFLVNSSDKQSLFSISVDVQNSDPNQSILPLPEIITSWLKIKKLAISIIAKKIAASPVLEIAS